jgi:phosphate transport system permease protein
MGGVAHPAARTVNMTERKRRLERVAYWVFRALTYTVVAFVGFVVLDVLVGGIGALSWEFLTAFPREAGSEGGILPAIVGTLCLVAGTVVVALPLGMASSIYLSEYATQGRFVGAVRLAIVTLAGVPSIVFGLFGLGLFVLFMQAGTSILSGSLTLACMILPTIIVASEEALKAVPHSFREGSLALGATKWQTIRKSVLPYAIPGMITGSILGIGRAAGETAPIMLTAAAALSLDLPTSLFHKVMALPYHLFYLSTQNPEVEKVRPLQYGTALVLLLVVLGLNLAAILYRIRLRKKYRW